MDVAGILSDALGPDAGRLQHIVAYDHASKQTNSGAPFGPGRSGGVLVASGLVLGVQVAAMRPRFDVGYAQTLDVSLAWLKKKLRATALECAHVVTHHE